MNEWEDHLDVIVLVVLVFVLVFHHSLFRIVAEESGCDGHAAAY